MWSQKAGHAWGTEQQQNLGVPAPSWSGNVPQRTGCLTALSLRAGDLMPQTQCWGPTFFLLKLFTVPLTAVGPSLFWSLSDTPFRQPFASGCFLLCVLSPAPWCEWAGLHAPLCYGRSSFVSYALLLAFALSFCFADVSFVHTVSYSLLCPLQGLFS